MKLEHEIEAIKNKLLGSLLVNELNLGQAKAAFQVAMAGALDELVRQKRLAPDYQIDVKRNPHSPDVLDVDIKFTPPGFFILKHCWDCGSGVKGPPDADHCPCGGELHDRPRTALDALKEAVGDET